MRIEACTELFDAYICRLVGLSIAPQVQRYSVEVLLICIDVGGFTLRIVLVDLFQVFLCSAECIARYILIVYEVGANGYV